MLRGASEMKAITYIMAGIVGFIFLAAIFTFPANIHKISAHGEATILAININDAAKQVLAIPQGSSASVKFAIPDNLAGQSYVLVVRNGKIIIAIKDGSVFQYPTIINSTSPIFSGGDTVILSSDPTTHTVEVS